VTRTTLFRKHIALPQQHGSWALWLGPLAAGAGVAGEARPALLWLVVAALGGFLLLQPLTILTKSLAGRRSRDDVPPALFWLACYGALALAGAIGLLAAGQGRVLWLGLAGLPVLAWQMALVARRAERGQVGVELVGAGVLALAAPAAYWVGVGRAAPTGWWLWGLCWLLSAGAIVYVYLRLEHRRLPGAPPWPQRWVMARRTLLYNFGNLVVVAVLAGAGAVPWLALIPFGAMAAEAAYGSLLRPAAGARPVVLGLRQMLITLVNSALLIAAYRL
jgi:YwiC-like protein